MVSTPDSTPMEPTLNAEAAPEGAAPAPRKRGRPKGSKNLGPTKSPADLKGSPEAKKTAALVLEVLGGLRQTRDAAEALGVTDSRYYAVEARAIQGLVTACEPKKAGYQGPSPVQELEKLRRENVHLERQCARLAALVRATQRTVGIAPPAEKQTKSGKPRKKRRGTVRALVAAQALRDQTTETAPASVPAPVKEG